MRWRASHSTPGRIAAAMISPRKTSAITILIFQSARASAITATAISVATKALRAVCPMLAGFSPRCGRCKRRIGRRRVEAGRAMPADEEIYFDARPHGVVLARPLGRAAALLLGGAALLALPWPAQVPGAALVATAAAVLLRAVWRWERTRVVVTREKVCVVDGTLRRRSTAVRLRSVENLELEQT